MANARVEEVMRDRAEQAQEEARRRYPGLRESMVSIANGAVIVDVKQKNGKWTRFEHVVEVDELALEAADASTRIKTVKQGRLT